MATAQIGRIPMDAFLCWAMRLLSVLVQRGNTETHCRNEMCIWRGTLYDAGLMCQCRCSMTVVHTYRVCRGCSCGEVRAVAMDGMLQKLLLSVYAVVEVALQRGSLHGVSWLMVNWADACPDLLFSHRRKQRPIVRSPHQTTTAPPHTTTCCIVL